jgi:hypothetical protein
MTGSVNLPISARVKYRQANGRVTRAVAQKTSKNFQPHGKDHVFADGFVTNYCAHVPSQVGLAFHLVQQPRAREIPVTIRRLPDPSE